MTSLGNPAAFFVAARRALFAAPLTTPQVSGMNDLLKAMGAAEWPVSWTAYGLATAFHETGRTMQPVHEKGSGDKNHDGEDDYFEQYDTGPKAAALGNTPAHDGDGEKWAGRGYPQVTGARNYAKIDAALHLGGALIANPDIMLQSHIAAPAMVLAMETGLFTGKSCASYLPSSTTGTASIEQFTQARRIINGVDRAAIIAGYADLFQKSLTQGAWA